MIDFEQQYEDLKRKTVESIRNLFPIKGKVREISVENIQVKDAPIDDYESQLDIRMKQGSLTSAVTGTVILKEGNKVISKANMRLANVPRITQRGSYLIDGNEYQVPIQARLRPGVFHRVKDNQELESFINLKGFQSKILFDPEKVNFLFNIGTVNIKLLPLLHGLGLSRQQIEAAWGKEVYEIAARNAKSTPEQEVSKLYKALFRKTGSDIGDILGHMETLEMDKRVTDKTLKGHEKISPQMLLDSSAKLLEINRKDTPEDERDSLEFKSIHGVDDFVAERFDKMKHEMSWKIKSKIDKVDDVRKIISSTLLNKPVKGFFTNSSLSSTTEQINPLHMIGNVNKITITGENGLENEQSITSEARIAHPSQLGFIDPVHTPESQNIGVTNHLSSLSIKEGNDLFTYMKNARTGKTEKLRTDQVNNSIVAFADEYHANGKPKSPIVSASVRGKVQKVPANKVDYILVNSKSMFDIATNLIPFMASVSGNRSMMAGKHMEQTLPLINREAPLVQNKAGGSGTFEQFIGQQMNVRSRIDGRVTSLTENAIFVNGEKHSIYNNFPLKSKVRMHHTPTVKVGDMVKRGQELAELNYNKGGSLALGTNLNVGYVGYKGYNFEDGVVITETAAKKLSSDHMYKENLDLDDNSVLSKRKFTAMYPTMFNSMQTQNIDEDGIIKKGSKVKQGDPLILHLRKEDMTKEDRIIASFKKSAVKSHKARPLVWEAEDDGEVVRVVRNNKNIEIHITNVAPMKIGDKLAGRHGNKGTVTKIIPDGEALIDESGNPVEVYMNPHGIPGRVNPSQNIELGAGKIARKTGKPFIVDNFAGRNYLDEVQAEMKRLGISDMETLTDASNGHTLDERVQVGPEYIIKMDHSTEKKFSTRAQGGYTVDMQPTQGKGQGGQSMDQLTLYSMLAHGANHNLREMSTIKGEKNEEFWHAYQSGLPLPAPKVPFVFEKMRAMMAGAGVNVERRGDALEMIPLTEKQIDSMSEGKINNPFTVRAKDLKPEKGGLFDESITGGPNGDRWTHIELNEPMPMPLYEEAILGLTGMRKSDMIDILAGRKFVTPDGQMRDDEIDGAIPGGNGLKRMLQAIDLPSLEIRLNAQAKKAKGSDLDKINRKLRYIKALRKNNMTPSDYMTKKIPVIPPKFRPIMSRNNGDLIVSDANQLYADVIKVNDQLKTIEDLPDSEKSSLRSDLYKGMSGIVGTGDSLTKKGDRDWKGFVKQIAGKSPKEGFFQSKVISKRQDFAGRSTIIPDPEYGLDDLGIPEEMAWNSYRAPVIRALTRTGLSPLEARNAVENRTEIARKTLINELENRPAIINRAPSLHKFSVMSFKPRLVQGKAIKINPLVVGGFNADFDGDTMSLHVPMTEDARKEAFQMMPSNNLLNPQTNTVEHKPSQDGFSGLYVMTMPPKTLKPVARYMNIKELETAYKAMKVRVRDVVVVRHTPNTVGRHLVNDALPEKYRSKNIVLDKKALSEILQDMAENDQKSYGRVVSRLKDLGNMAAFTHGTSFGLGDLTLQNREKIRKEMNKLERELMMAKDKDKFIEEFSKKMDNSVIIQEVEQDLKRKESGLYDLMKSSLGGKRGQINQMMVGPMFVNDYKNKPVPVLIKNSFADGLTSSEYFTTLAGARKGMMDRQLSTADSGYLSKELVNNVLFGKISEDDCKTTAGTDVDISDMPLNIIDRFTAAGNLGVKPNTLITMKLLKELSGKGVKTIKIRSPLTCKAKNVPCAKCFGLRENGQVPQVGDNIGVLAGQSLAEPSTQLTMKCSSGLISTVNGIIPMSLFFQQSTIESIEDDVETAIPCFNVMDKCGQVETLSVQRHKPHDDIYLIKTRSGACVLTQGNHPMWVNENQIRKGFSNRNTKLVGDMLYKCTSTTPRVMANSREFNLIVKPARDISREDTIWVDYSSLYGGDVVPDIDPYIAGYFAAEGSFRVGNGTEKYEGVKVATIFSLSSNSPWFNQDIIGSKLNVPFSAPQKSYTVYGLEYAKNLSMYIGYSCDEHRAHNKCLMMDIASLSPEWCQRFLEAYIDGDGHVFESSGVTVAKTTSTSWELTSQIVAICHKLGLHPSVMSTDSAPSRDELRTSFDIEIRFSSSYSPLESMKIKDVKPMKHQFGAIRGYDSVTLVKKLRNWSGYVYDVKTKTSGYMAGTIHNHNSFHTGGAVGGSTLSGFDVASNILHMPKVLPNKATLSTVDGRVTKVSKAPQGGWYISVKGEEHYGLERPIVKENQLVKRGDRLTEGNIKPQELAELTDAGAARKMVSESIFNAYKDSGRTVRKNLIETAVSLIARHATVTDPGDADDVTIGDRMAVNEIEERNKTLANKIKFKEIINGIGVAPFHSEDFLARMNFNHIPQTITRGASMGWKSQLHGENPIPGYAYGAEFGLSPTPGANKERTRVVDIPKFASAEEEFLDGLR